MTSVAWSGVFPAVTTQFKADLSIDHEGTARVVDALLADGVHGIVALGTVGENNSLSAEEKRDTLRTIVEAVDGRAPVLAGVSELTPTAAARYAADAERIGVDGLMALPAMVYVPLETELEHHFRTVAAASSLPIMLYNNPPAYRVSIEAPLLARLADVPTIVALKESAVDTRRFTDVLNACGDRFAVFAGLDDVAFEGLALGAAGWISGLTNAFPRESLALYELIRAGRYGEARTLYRWFLPLLHMDSDHRLVHYIKLAEAVMGRGSERVRPPRLPLEGDLRAQVKALVERAAAARPTLPGVGLAAE